MCTCTLSPLSVCLSVSLSVSLSLCLSVSLFLLLLLLLPLFPTVPVTRRANRLVLQVTYGSFDYTCLLYLSTYHEDFTGGRFVFAVRFALFCWLLPEHACCSICARCAQLCCVLMCVVLALVLAVRRCRTRATGEATCFAS